MKKYVLKNKIIEEYGIISESYFKTIEELKNAMHFLIKEYNKRNILKRNWSKEDFEIIESEEF